MVVKELNTNCNDQYHTSCEQLTSLLQKPAQYWNIWYSYIQLPWQSSIPKTGTTHISPSLQRWTTPISQQFQRGTVPILPMNKTVTNS